MRSSVICLGQFPHDLIFSLFEVLCSVSFLSRIGGQMLKIRKNIGDDKEVLSTGLDSTDAWKELISYCITDRTEAQLIYHSLRLQHIQYSTHTGAVSASEVDPAQGGS